jgi:putative methyltransferase
MTNHSQLTPVLAILLAHDLLLAKKGVAASTEHVLKLAITRHKARLGAEFTKARIRNGHATLDAFREAVSNGGLEADDGAQKARHPRWVRVNTIKTTLDQQLTTTFAGFKKVDDIAEVLVARGTAKLYYEDPNIPNLLALPSKMNMTRSTAYTKGEIIFQDKASCFPAYLLDLSPDDGDVIDGCAAPGNKTTHIAATVAEHGHAQKVIAFERDKARTTTLHKMVKLAGADRIVIVKGSSDFLAATPDTNDFASVGAIVLDPSCSGTGIVGRDDAIKMHLPEAPAGMSVVPKAEKGKKRKRGEEVKTPESATLTVDLDDTTAEETPVDGKLSERLATLSRFQLHILTHAMRFKNARKITYSTCSIHFEENEGVVLQALASSLSKKRGWSILKRESQVDGLKTWERRGVWEEGKLTVDLDETEREGILDSCIRCDKDTDEGTMGFFVAAFVRGDPQEPTTAVASVHAEDDEWSGFADENEEATKGEEAVAEPPKKRKKKKRKASVV